LVYIGFCLFFGIMGALAARAKGNSWLLWGLISAIFPVLGLIGAMVYRSEREELRRQCPTCGALRPISDAMCLRCGTELDFPDMAVESEAAAESARLTAPGH
jgi:hypothetical protein